MHMCTLVQACGLKAVNKESESESGEIWINVHDNKNDVIPIADL